jgi:nucleoside-diphosphate-sugar epimerase
MISIFITGSTGFVGKNIIKIFNSDFKFCRYTKNDDIVINEDIVLHFAGKAHDLKITNKVEDYYVSNTILTKNIFDNFIESRAKVFITLSSVKAVADFLDIELTESVIPSPLTEYGKSKLLAEEYILSKINTYNKRIYILRPCMIHGPGNKGNLNLLYNLISKGIPWPLGCYKNYRSYLSIDNLCFIIKELIENENIPSGIYNVADDVPLSTNEIVKLIAESKGIKFKIMNISKPVITLIAKLGDFFKLSLNSERLIKLTENYIISNSKIKKAIGKDLPISSKDGLIRTFQSFSENA